MQISNVYVKETERNPDINTVRNPDRNTDRSTDRNL